MIPLMNEVIGILIQILRCMNKAQDDVKITPGQGGKKGGKKNRRRVPVMQLGQEEEVRTGEQFVWARHIRVNDVYESVVKVSEQQRHDSIVCECNSSERTLVRFEYSFGN